MTSIEFSGGPLAEDHLSKRTKDRLTHELWEAKKALEICLDELVSEKAKRSCKEALERIYCGF